MSKLNFETDILNEIQNEIEVIRDVKDLIPSENEEERKVLWVLFGTEGEKGKVNRSKDVKYFGKGEGYDVLEKKLLGATNQVYFAFVRFFMFDVYKYILISYSGKKVSMILRGQMFSFMSTIRVVFKDMKHVVTHLCTKENEVGIDEVMFKLKKSAGSNY